MRESMFINLEEFHGEDKHLVKMIVGLVNRLSKKTVEFS